MKSHLLILNEDDAALMRHRIKESLNPEFEWLGAWKPCEAGFTVRGHRGHRKLWLQPMLWCASGASVPYSLPVRFAECGEALMRHIEQHYRQNYRMAPIQDRLASFGAAMAGDEKQKRRKKGGA